MTQAESLPPSPPSDGKRNYWLYGSNVALLVVIAVVIITLVMALTAPVKAKWDLTANGAYSLSGYTQQLLKDLDQKKEKYELINVFRPSDPRQQQVQDILDEYARASNNITVEDLSQLSRDQIVQKIHDRYASELQPYEDVIKDYRKVASDLDKFSKTEGANMGAVAQQPGATDATQKDAAQLQGLFGEIMPELLSETRRDVNRATDNTTPDYSAATTSIKTNFGQVMKQLTLLSNQQQIKDMLSPPVAKMLADEQQQYAAMLKELTDYLVKIDKLPTLKVQDILGNLGPATVVVLGPTSAAVVSETSIYKAPADENSQAAPAFQGEQAVSSALLPMIQPNKVKVVFVSSSSALHPTTSTTEEGWSSMADRLRAVNFDILEWAPPSPPTGPDQQPSSPTPPAEGKGVVWVVFPPDPANPQAAMMGMPPPSPQPVIDAVKKHLDEGGQVLFLADAAGPSMFGGPEGYPYADLLKPFGIDVQSKYTVVHNYPDQAGGRRVFPQVVVNRYKDHSITKPLQALQTMFAGFSSRTMPGFFGAPTVVAVAKSIPAGVDAQVIVDSPDDSDTWAQATYNQTAPLNKETDLAAPCPLAAASTKDAGKPDEQRVVVLSSRTIGCNSVIDAINARENDSGSAELFVVNPGNGELVTNSVLWLGGYKNMIAVSAKSAAAARIRSIPPAMMTFIDAMLFFGIPLCALLLGGVVYMFRRR